MCHPMAPVRDRQCLSRPDEWCAWWRQATASIYAGLIDVERHSHQSPVALTTPVLQGSGNSVPVHSSNMRAIRNLMCRQAEVPLSQLLQPTAF